jgi:hypothetical protein
MKQSYRVDLEVPAILNESGRALPVGTVATVTKEFFYNGESWFRTVEFGDVPSVFFELEAVS